MKDEELKKVRKTSKAFTALARAVDQASEKGLYYVPETLFNQIDLEIKSAAELSNVLPAYNPHSFLQHDNTISLHGVRGYLLRCISALEFELEEVPPATISGPLLSFSFVQDTAIRQIVERAYPELLTAFNSGCKKSSLILAGSIIESILLDFVLQNKQQALSSQKVPKENNILRWDLDDLIEVSSDIKLELAAVHAMSHTIRKYRNLVHPSVEIRSDMKVELEEARVAISVVQILHRELSK